MVQVATALGTEGTEGEESLEKKVCGWQCGDKKERKSPRAEGSGRRPSCGRAALVPGCVHGRYFVALPIQRR
ncbi:hypothetical protein IMZ48_26675 [Candidatus Bathyarchaeota archaeon]|nr:hypothetical protein [Candidatus Bathyarchaeota archaeon]